MGMWDRYKRPLEQITGLKAIKCTYNKALKADVAGMADYLAHNYGKHAETAHLLMYFDNKDKNFHVYSNFTGEERFFRLMAVSLIKALNKLSQSSGFDVRLHSRKD